MDDVASDDLPRFTVRRPVCRLSMAANVDAESLCIRSIGCRCSGNWSGASSVHTSAAGHSLSNDRFTAVHCNELLVGIRGRWRIYRIQNPGIRSHRAVSATYCDRDLVQCSDLDCAKKSPSWRRRLTMRCTGRRTHLSRGLHAQPARQILAPVS